MTRKGFGNFVYVVLLCLLTLDANAKFTKVSIGVNGLTCSQCSRSVEMQLRKLSFVADVTMDLANTQGVILFKDNKKVDISSLAKAVKDAGFSLRYLNADMDVSDVQFAESGACFSYKNDAYQIIKPLPTTDTKLKLAFVGKDYNAEKNKTKPTAANLFCKGAKAYQVEAVQ